MAVEVPVYAIPDHIENWATALAALGASASLLFCVRHALRNHNPLAVFLWVGGALTVFIEPFPDMLGRARFAQVDRIKWVGALDSQIPMYIGLVYMFYLAPAYVLLLDAFKKGITRRQFGLVCGAMAVGAVAFEFVPMHYDLWRYFGSQGLQIGDGVVWWGFANSHGIIGTAVVLSLLLKVLPERRHFLIVPLMPPIFLGVHSAGAFFAYLTVGTTTNSTATFFGTLATDLMCCLFFWLYSQIVCAPASVAAVHVAAPVRSPVRTGN
jgi:hypothetical protein